MTIHIRRREFIGALGSTAAAWPLVALAQQATMPVIGVLSSSLPNAWAIRRRAFHQGLKEQGYIEGQNVAVEYRWAEGHNDRLPVLASELVGRQVALIAASGTLSAAAAKAATASIPIVFELAVDPVTIGLVASLNRPGGNLTGVTNLNVELGPKRLELLRELVPTASIIAVLVNPTSPSIAQPYVRALQAAAPALGLQLHILHASTERELDTALETLVQLRADALEIMPDLIFHDRMEQLGALALSHRLPAIFTYRPFVAGGGLMAYGPSETDNYRLVGSYAGRILKGDKPADLPVQQSTKVELIINLKTAKALGLTVPLTLLGRADEVIE